jgi:hypothetical protein
MKLLRFLSFLFLFLISGGLFAQQAVSPSKYNAAPPVQAAQSADQMVRVPITVAQFLALDSEAQRNVNSYQFSDLVQSNLGGREEGKFYLTEEQFYTSDEARKMKVLKAQDTYIVVANAAAKPKIQISQSYFNSLPQEKQTAILNSGEYQVGQ